MNDWIGATRHKNPAISPIALSRGPGCTPLHSTPLWIECPHNKLQPATSPQSSHPAPTLHPPPTTTRLTCNTSLARACTCIKCMKILNIVVLASGSGRRIGSFIYLITVPVVSMFHTRVCTSCRHVRFSTTMPGTEPELTSRLYPLQAHLPCNGTRREGRRHKVGRRLLLVTVNEAVVLSARRCSERKHRGFPHCTVARTVVRRPCRWCRRFPRRSDPMLLHLVGS
ncbi:hypothetical protein BZA05DRAFT_97254 [Tricharina praecox]|uniref:uncharacterized protein n=1 Tax=Tricharina praecox TaxID=43433 RepID=UPI0022206C76|nr:uncharacterized protein BZA05DRAFT_97254 [Tricharina praecox]KAI5848416.1 hypothetical protein BZA05DRAFT_97254 [Tricharina praecox]